jgi:hypothetical protein
MTCLVRTLRLLFLYLQKIKGKEAWERVLLRVFFIFLWHGTEVYGTWAASGSVVPATNDRWRKKALVERGREKPKYSERNLPQYHFVSHEIQCGNPELKHMAFSVRSRRITASNTVRPNFDLRKKYGEAGENWKRNFAVFWHSKSNNIMVLKWGRTGWALHEARSHTAFFLTWPHIL